MSYAAMEWARRQKTGSPVRKAVLLALANYADEEGACWPSQERIAADTELGERAVRNALRELEAAGLLTREERRHPSTKSRMTDVVRLQINRHDVPVARAHLPARRAETNRHQMPGLPAPDAGPTGTSCRNQPAPDAGKPLSRTSKDPPPRRLASPWPPPGATSESERADDLFGSGPERSADAPGSDQRIDRKPPEKIPKGRRLPEDYALTPALIDFARNEGLTDDQIRREFDRFRDHWLQAAGRTAVKRDWDAAWRNWGRTAVDRLGSPGRPASNGGGRAIVSRLDAYQRAAARFRD